MNVDLVVDLHVHSHHSRATSKNSNLEGLYKWGKLKGINIIGTGDFTHPEWFLELSHKLVPAEDGLYALNSEIAKTIDDELPPSVRSNLIRFIPTVEIATIYKKGDRVRKLHQLVVMPGLEAANALNARLERIGNLKADGRPILGLDSKELLRHSLQVSPDSLYIPAHIWTPWFGMFGSKSGFDSIVQAYDELSEHIYAIETGLSSDPPMSASVSSLAGIAITSHSDAHSPQKLGREATLVHANPSYYEIINAIKTNDQRLVGTIEFFPEEGKYHADGHRDCNIRFTPEQTKAAEGICPACIKPLVVGVQNRVAELGTLKNSSFDKKVEYIIPLAEIIAELKSVKSVSSRAVEEEYHKIIAQFGHEFSVLRSLATEQIADQGYPLLALALERLRAGNVVREPGFDGVYGTIKVFKNPSERLQTLNQLALL